MLTLGFDAPAGLARQLTSFAAAGVGLTLLALVIAYIPTVYAAFSRREAVITKLVVRAGAPPTGPAVLSSSWRLGRFDQLEEVWNGWEDWFVDAGESHTTFPQLSFFRSPHPENHWVLATEALTRPLCSRRSAMCRASPAASSAFMPGLTPWRRSQTFWGSRIARRNPTRRSHSLNRSSIKPAASCATSASRCARIARGPGLSFDPPARAMSPSWP